MSYGVTPDGFVIKPLEVIFDELESQVRLEISDTIDTSESAPFGQFLRIQASKLREVWEVAEGVYSAAYPSSANGVPLRNVGAITGTLPRAATRSTVVGRVTLAAGATLPIGRVASVQGNSAARFRTIEAVTNTGASPAQFNVRMESETLGPVRANAGTLTVIATPSTGWTAVTNVSDAVLGLAEETDEEFRIRREKELRSIGGTTVDAIRADLLTSIPLLRSVGVFENATDFTNGDGLPPHSFEAVVWDGSPTGTVVTADEIARRVWSSKPAGIATYGLATASFVDRLGITRTVLFSRPTIRNVYLGFEISVNASLWDPTRGPALIREAAVDLGDTTLGVGDDVIVARFVCAAIDIPGVTDVLVRAGFSASPVGTSNLAIGVRELADIDTSRITVTVTP